MSTNISTRLFVDPQSNYLPLVVNGDLTASNDTCVPLKEPYVQGVSVVPALIALENLLFLIAVGVNRNKLKHNNVYRYVASALVANFVTCLLGFYHFINYYHGFEPTEPNHWWALRKGMTMAMSLVMCGNIGLLIYAIEDSTYVVGRSTTVNHQHRSMDPTLRRRKAIFLICIVWALPTLWGLLAMTDWNCTNRCNCTLSYVSGKSICPDSRCSQIYTPMSKSYLLVVVILWALECTVLLMLLIRSICNVRSAFNDGEASGKKKYGFRKTLTIYKASHCVVFALFVIFFIFSAPVMILFILDFAMPDLDFSQMVVNCVSPLPMLYCLISPILVSQRLSGLKSAMLMAISFSRTKVTTRTRATPDKSTTAALNGKDPATATSV